MTTKRYVMLPDINKEAIARVHQYMPIQIKELARMRMLVEKRLRKQFERALLRVRP